MSYIEIDDDDDIVEDAVVESKTFTQQDKAKQVIKLGLEDANDIYVLLEKIEKIIEPFGDLDTILELKTLYGEVIPDLLKGDYSTLLTGVPEDEEEIATSILRKRRKTIFNKLADKYNG